MLYLFVVFPQVGDTLLMFFFKDKLTNYNGKRISDPNFKNALIISHFQTYGPIPK